MNNTHVITLEVKITMHEMEGTHDQSTLLAMELVQDLVGNWWGHEDVSVTALGDTL
jgi:hypothetical protein